MKSKISALLLFGFCAYIQAAQFTVDVLDDRADPVVGDGVCGLPDYVLGGPWCSLRAAIQESNALAGEDIIILTESTYQLSLGDQGEEDNVSAVGDLNIFEDLEIVGNNAVIDAAGAYRVFEIEGAKLTIENITIDNAFSATDGAAIFAINAKLALDGLVIKNSYAENDGGGLFAAGGMVSISNSRFDENHAEQAGGGIAIEESQLSLDQVVFYGNESEDGGAVYAAAMQSISMQSVDFWSNVAQRFGGGLMLEGFSLFDGESYDSAAYSSRNFEFDNTRFGANWAVSGSGGGIYLEHLMSSVNQTRLAISNCLFQDNQGFNGGGIASYSGDIQITSCLFNNNEATSESGQGGAIYSNSLVSLSDVTIDENYARAGAGAIRTFELEMLNTTLVNNDSFSDGVIDDDVGLEVISELLVDPSLDSDFDGIPDVDDNCPYIANAEQLNVGGTIVGTGDEYGDACQCGDVNDDGVVNNADAVIVTRHAAGLPPGVNDSKCDVTGDGNCDGEDATRIRNVLLGSSGESLQQCEAAQSRALDEDSGSEISGSAIDSFESGSTGIVEVTVHVLPVWGLVALTFAISFIARRSRKHNSN